MPILQKLQQRRKFKHLSEKYIPLIKQSKDVYEITDIMYKLLSDAPRDGALTKQACEKDMVDNALSNISEITEYRALCLKFLAYLENDNAARINRITNKLQNSAPKTDLNSVIPKNIKSTFDAAFPKIGDPKTKNAYNEEITFSHNGGLKFVLSFLEGQNLGYKLETQQSFGGIQVMPFNTSLPRTSKPVMTYLDHARYSFDIPVFFKGKSLRKYIDAADNDLEAGIRSCYASEIYDLEIKICLHIENLGYREGEKITTDAALIRSLQKIFKTEFFELKLDQDATPTTKPWKYLDLTSYYGGEFSGLQALDLSVREDQCLLGNDPLPSLGNHHET